MRKLHTLSLVVEGAAGLNGCSKIDPKLKKDENMDGLEIVGDHGLYSILRLRSP